MHFPADNSPVLITVVLLAAYAIYRTIIYPSLVSPLSRVPNAHFTSSVSPAWILWTRYKQRENATVHAAHQRNGPVVRLGPNEISVNCVKGGIQTVYAGGFEKHDWYPNIFMTYGKINMFSMIGSKVHSARKRMLSNVYSKSYLHSSQTMLDVSRAVLYDRLLPLLAQAGASETPLDMFEVYSATTMDYVTDYIFGLSAGTDFVREMHKCAEFLQIYMFRRDLTFWPQELPGLTSWLSWFRIRLVPRSVDVANQEIEDFGLKMCDKALLWLQRNGEATEAKSAGEYPVVLAQLKSAMDKETKKSAELPSPNFLEHQRLEIASEMLDHLLAGFETSAITLTYMTHELSQRPRLQTALRHELKTLQPHVRLDSAPQLPEPRTIDGLPLLHAVLYETLRLHSAIPGGEPRITPSNGCTLGDYDCIPGGVRVSAAPFSLHRNNDVFPDPEMWKPERWLTQDGALVNNAEMMRWFWVFSSGGRMCVGSNLAIYQIEHIIAAIYTNFETTIIDDDGIEQVDSYTAPPKSSKLMIQLKAADL